MKKSIYSVHPSVRMVQDWIATLKEKSGRSLEEWLELIKNGGPPSEKERRDWLKNKYKLGTNTAWWLAERAEGKGSEDSDPAAYLKAAETYVEDMYKGGKAGLLPIHDRILKTAVGLGKDVKVCPCQTIVPLYRNHVFAQIKPATQKRIDLGFALKDRKATGRLIDTGGFAKKDRITHRIEITAPSQVDDVVLRRMKTAYEMDA